MKKVLLFCAGLFGAVSLAHATAVVSNVSYTATSITYTETGDLIGYATPASNSGQFGIAYLGNLLIPNGDQMNSYSGHLLAGDEPSIGYTGTFDIDPSYTWFPDTGLTFSGTSFTISWPNTELNTTGTGTFEFFWGGGFEGASGFTVLNSVNVVNGVVQGSQVPEPASVALLGVAVLGLAAARKRNLKR